MSLPEKRTHSEDSPHVPPKKRYRRVAPEDEESGGASKNEDESDNELQHQIRFVETSTPKPPPQQQQKEGKAWQMMSKMGYKDGGGLGAQGQGRAEPIDVKLRAQRRGLGAEVKGLEPSLDVTWDEEQEEITVEEYPEWVPECNLEPPTTEEMEEWIKIGPKQLVIDNESEFCDAEVLSEMLQAKNVFDELDDRSLRNARSRANPFETIKGAFFQNRAAMKMANLDAVFNDLFTNPKLSSDKLWVANDGNDLFYFADVCAGPGGFTEYVLWRRGWSAHGFGLTLKGKDDFKLDDFLAAAPELFEPYYGKGGLEGDGDATNPENLEAFREFVMKSTNGQGVHTFMADGGFSVEGQENIQEILSKRLYLCQVLCAMNILRSGGSLVCKLFDVFTPFSVGLLYLLWRSFDEICLHKPHTSRPANSERYVICKGMRDGVDAVKTHMANANLAYAKLVEEGRSRTEDVMELVPMEVLKNETGFFTYVCNSNNKLAKRQSLYLHKYKAFARNPMLQDSRQEDLRARCMRYWKVPDEKRPPPPRPNPNQRMEELCANYHAWLTSAAAPSAFDPEILDSSHEHEAYRVLLRTGKPTIFLALGKRFIFSYEGQRWESVDQPKLSIPRGTILYAELTSRIRGEGKGQIQTQSLRVFDAYCLGGENISERSFSERRRLLTKFCAAIHKSSRPDLADLFVAEAWHIGQLPALRKQFFVGKVRGGSKPLYRYQPPAAGLGAGINGVMASSFDLIAQGFIIVRVIKDEWKLAWSRRENRIYFFNTKTRESVFERREDAFNGFVPMYCGRKVWPGLKPPPSKNNDESAVAEHKRAVNPEEEFLSSLLGIIDSVESQKAASSCSS